MDQDTSKGLYGRICDPGIPFVLSCKIPVCLLSFLMIDAIFVPPSDKLIIQYHYYNDVGVKR